MSDFEERLSRALEAGAEGAPGAAGISQVARRRARVRRQQRIVAGSVAAVLAIAVPAAILGRGDAGPAAPGPAIAPDDRSDDILVSCGGARGWPVSAMVDGAESDLEEAEVRRVFADLEAEMGIDAPRAIQAHGAEEAPYVVLADGGDEIMLGVGRWTVDGPQDDAMYLMLERTSEGIEAGGWGDCTLVVALPEDRSRVAVTAPEGGVDPATASPEVLVNEIQCASGRDPSPHLDEPQVVETEDRVLVTMTSEPVEGAAHCQGSPPVPFKLELDAPIGIRLLFDAGTWPPTPIRVADTKTVAHEDVEVRIPADWAEHECDSGDGLVMAIHGPGTAEQVCDGGSGLAFRASATFDPSGPAGETVRADAANGEPVWTGWVAAGDWAVIAWTPRRELTRQILDSVRRS